MKKAFKILLAVILLAAFFTADYYSAHNNFITNSTIFVKNDFEKTQFDHPEKVWDKVFFGNSVVINWDKEWKGFSKG
mgnify:CR=1 FL=1